MSENNNVTELNGVNKMSEADMASHELGQKINGLHNQKMQHVARLRDVHARTFHLFGAYVNGMTSMHGNFDWGTEDALNVMSNIRVVVEANNDECQYQIDKVEAAWDEEIAALMNGEEL